MASKKYIAKHSMRFLLTKRMVVETEIVRLVDIKFSTNRIGQQIGVVSFYTEINPDNLISIPISDFFNLFEEVKTN